MTELNLIFPCCIGTGCSYNTGLVEGYVLGIITVIMVFILVEIVNILSENNVEKDKTKEE